MVHLDMPGVRKHYPWAQKLVWLLVHFFQAHAYPQIIFSVVYTSFMQYEALTNGQVEISAGHVNF